MPGSLSSGSLGPTREPLSAGPNRETRSVSDNRPSFVGPPAPDWLQQLGKKVDNPRIDLSDKNAVYQDLLSSHYHSIKKSFHQDLVSDKISRDDKKLLITEVINRLEELSMQDHAHDYAQGHAQNEDKKQFNQKLLSDVLRHVDDDTLLQHAYLEVEGKLDKLARGPKGCLTMYTSRAFHHAVADTEVDSRKIRDETERKAADKTAFYRGLESSLSDIRGTRVKSIISVADDQQKLVKLARHLLDRSFISPTLQHQDDIRKVFSSFQSEPAKAKAFKVFADVVGAELDKMDKRMATLPARRAYVSHLAGVMTTFKSIKPGTPGGKAIEQLDRVIGRPKNMKDVLAFRNFPLEYRNVGTDALAGHLPNMPYKLRQEVLNHIKTRAQAQESLDAPRKFKDGQVSKMIMASVLGYPNRNGKYPAVEQSNYARILDKKTRQDLVKLVYQNRHALSKEDKADLMKVFKHFKDEVSSGREQGRWSRLRLFTRGGRTVNRMNEIGDQSVPML